VADGTGVTHSNIAEAQPERALSIHDVRLQVLSTGDAFDLEARRPAEVPTLSQGQALEQVIAGSGEAGAVPP
jgi:cyanophycinase